MKTMKKSVNIGEQRKAEKMQNKKPQNYLFVCYANLNRSKTAEDVCRRIARERNLQIDVSSAGISKGAENPLTIEKARQADIIFVMEDYMKKFVQELGDLKQEAIICLNIFDMYARNDPELVKILEMELDNYLY